MPHPVTPSRRSRVPFYCLGLLATLAACEMLGPAEAPPPGAMQLIAPPEYEAWWAATEACAGRSSDYHRVEWYVVPDVRTFQTAAGEKVGLWSHSSGGMRIILAGDYADNELVVRHEMLHALLDREGHPAEYFQDRCHLTWESWHPAE